MFKVSMGLIHDVLPHGHNILDDINIHLPAMFMFSRVQGFDPYANLSTCSIVVPKKPS